MGSSAKEVLASAVALTTAYAGGASSGEIYVGPHDSIGLGIKTTAGSPTSLSLRFLSDGVPLMRVTSDGSLEVDEVTYDLSISNNLSLRLDTRAINKLEVQIKGDATGTIDEISVVREGSDNRTPPAM